MKISKKLISMLLVLVFVISTITIVPVSAATFSDVTGTEKYSQAVNFLSSLGVINGYEDGTFRPLNNVTRAEFTAMLMRYRGYGQLGSTSLENPPYPDVTTSDVSWAIGNIRTAQSLGIVNGYEDGTFRPKNNVLFEEAVKMIICALGYESYSPEGVYWYSKYITSATKLGLLKNADGSVGTPATRACIAQLLYNCNEVDVPENSTVIIGGGGSSGGTVLEGELNLTKKTGLVYSNKTTSLQKPDIDLRDDEMLIYDIATKETTIYVVENIDKYRDMLGCRVDFYYKSDREIGDNVITTMSGKKNSYITIDVADIEDADSSATSIVYYENGEGNEKKVSINESAIVVYNEKLYGATAAESSFSDFLEDKGGFPLIGSIKLLDNTGDSVYDIVFVDDYEIYVATSVLSSSYTVTDTLTRVQPNHTITLNPKTDDNLIFTDKNGSELTFSSIKKGSVLCVKKSNTANGGEVLTTVVIVNDSVSGTVESVSNGKYLKISGVTYDFSYAAPWMNPESPVSLPQPSKSESGTFYRDLNGDIVAYDKKEVTTNQQYGYIITAAVDTKDMEDTLQLYILTKSGKTEYSCYDGTTINGESDKTQQEMFEMLQAAALYQGQNTNATNLDSTGYASQLIKFSTKTVNGGTVVSEILTAKEVAAKDITEIVSDELYMSDTFNTVSTADASTYTKSSTRLKSGSATANIKSSVLFSIPDDRADFKNYKTISVGSLLDGEKYNVEIYDQTQTGATKAAVFYNMGASVGKVNNNTRTFIVTEIVPGEINPENDNEEMYKIYGFKDKDKTIEPRQFVWGSVSCNDAFAKLKEGDVVRFGTDADGFATFDVKDRLFSLVEDRADIISTYAAGDANFSLGNSDDDDERYHFTKSALNDVVNVIWGYIYACDDDALVILDKYFAPGTTEDIEKYKHDFSISNISGSLVLIYDDKSDLTETNIESAIIKSDEKAEFLKTLPNLAGGVEPTEIFIYDIDNYPSVIVIKGSLNN